MVTAINDLMLTRGLEYLHEHCNPPVVHRDIKSSNILLDSHFNAKVKNINSSLTFNPHLFLSIALYDANWNYFLQWVLVQLSDFGLAVTSGIENKNIKLSGTLGYVAPEYLLEGMLKLSTMLMVESLLCFIAYAIFSSITWNRSRLMEIFVNWHDILPSSYF